MAYSGHNKRTGTFQVKFDDLFGIIKQSAREVIKKTTYALKDDIQKVWPVDTGRSRDGWRVGGHARGWTIYNAVTNPHTGYDYVSDLWNGSSQQLPMGGDPIVQFRRLMLRTELKNMQFKPATQSYARLRRRGKPSLGVDDV